MRRPYSAIGALICLFVVVSCFGFTGTTYAESGEKFLTAGSYVNIWVLNKETRKMMFVSFQEADELWKSQVEGKKQAHSKEKKHKPLGTTY